MSFQTGDHIHIINLNGNRCMWTWLQMLTCIAVQFQNSKYHVVHHKLNVTLISLPKKDLDMRLLCFVFKSKYSIIHSLFKTIPLKNMERD